LKKLFRKIINKEGKSFRGLLDFFLLLFLAFVLAVIFYFVIDRMNFGEEKEEAVVPVQDTVAAPTMLYGIGVDSFRVIESKVGRDVNFSTLLSQYNVPLVYIHKLVDSFSSVFDFRRLRYGNKYTMMLDPGSSQPKYFIYETDPISYVVVNFDSTRVYKGIKNVDTITREISGIINTSLWVDMIESGAPQELITAMADLYAWQVDFFSISNGDRFKIIFDEVMLDSTSLGIGKIKTALFVHNDENFYAIGYRQDGIDDYFDERGNCLRKMFLKAPLKFSRISSRFTRSRYHPILKIYRPHLAIDYVAPKGTPVHTIGDGVVISAGYSGGAGNMVKIRHNNSYISGYNHLSRFAPGIRSGRRVKQGELIGYVGSTGLSTGPHLDFRIWKNGANINPLSIKAPPAKSVDKAHIDEFNKIRNKMLYELKKIPYPAH
jgi:murein DD-endopeptidase MepM/ murein hydrolase activator NlpD